MALEFRLTADLHALDAVKNGKRIASLQWHRNAKPHIVIAEAFGTIDLDDLREIVEKLTLVSTPSGW